MAQLYTKPTAPKKRPTIPWMKIGVNTLIFGGIVYLLVSFYPVLSVQAQYYLSQWANGDNNQYQTEELPEKSFGNHLEQAPELTTGPELPYAPVNTNFSVVIPKINVNTPVVADVNPGDKRAYMAALNDGAAHALGTAKPGEVGNAYVFAHSTADIFNIERYAAVFTLLNKLEVDDRITTFYNNTRYDYKVSRKYIVDFNDVHPLTATYDRPVLTLQTCDPPGTEFKRLIITAELIGTYSK
jgi:LPXTG-site transpeptidase (sortase) family protein